MGQLVLQVSLDTLSLFIVMFVFGREQIALTKKPVLWCIVLFSYILLIRLNLNPSDDGLVASIGFQNYELLPGNSLQEIIGLLCVLLLINSTVFKLNHLEVIFTTLLAFISWFFLRLISIGVNDLLEYPIDFFRFFTVLLTIILYWKFSLKIKRFLSSTSNVFTKLMIVNVFTLILLMVISANFESIMLFQNRIQLFLILFFTVIFLSWLLIEQRKSEILENRIRTTEQYIPIIDELVLEVRAKQHEFSNKLLAISSLVETTDDIQIARAKMQDYVKSSHLSNGQYELLNMDHKIIAGFLYTKMKRAEQLKINLQIERTISVHQFRCEDADLIEVLGILIDNALEASLGGDTIYLALKEVNGYSEVTVSNPADYLSNDQFMQLFELGYSTKSSHAFTRGYGLHNVKEIAERYNGKVIARNDQRNVHLITLGIQF